MILVLMAVLGNEDKEVLAYLIIRSINGPGMVVSVGIAGAATVGGRRGGGASEWGVFTGRSSTLDASTATLAFGPTGTTLLIGSSSSMPSRPSKSTWPTPRAREEEAAGGGGGGGEHRSESG